ncbi:MAG: YdeI/OmpD-associated family protein [Cyclobacteriaceae bacterium]
MDTSLKKKLLTKEGYSVLLLNPPKDFRTMIKSGQKKPADVVIAFVKSKADIVKLSNKAIEVAKEDGVLWFAYPKISSGIKTDINRDSGWEVLQKKKFEPVTQIAIDETWSALRFKPVDKIPKMTRKTAIGSKQQFEAILESPNNGMDATFVSIPFDVEEVFGTKGNVKVKATFDKYPYRGIIAKMGMPQHVIIVRQDVRAAINKKVGDKVKVTIEKDLEERIVDVPIELEKILSKNAKAKNFFDSLSFTNRKEYALWISSAKRPDTKEKRLTDILVKLLAGKKNPSEK